MKADDVDCKPTSCRVIVQGRSPLRVRFAAPVDPARTKAAYRRKKNELRVTFVRADVATAPAARSAAPAARAPAPAPATHCAAASAEHASFMEDLGRTASARGYVPPMSGMEEVSDDIKKASRG